MATGWVIVGLLFVAFASSTSMSSITTRSLNKMQELIRTGIAKNLISLINTQLTVEIKRKEELNSSKFE
jgi:hypothetical protein